ncbi:unnamed protein product [Cuscuta campestris]|uniref:F-box domain-containing protein n=1 Tax=Cuscuta campestris TaxID=132261 RepID=A0A484NTH5_9ASTE|nr:unnamed protein product [Cuscuta campestris]
MERHVAQHGANARDRFSQLPVEILDHIMGFLPIRQAAKVAVVSKVWRDVWSSLTLLCFDHGFFRVAGKKSSKEARKDINARSRFHVITQILLQHRGSIRKFVCFYALAMTEIVRFPSLDVDECSETGKFLPDNLDLKSISTLDMDYYSLKDFVGQYTTKEPSLQMPALNVELLKLLNFCSQDDDELISAFVCLLSNCPKLCNLEISLSWAGNINKCIDVTFGNLRKFRSVLRTHKRLLCLKLRSFRGLRPQMQFVKEMLAWLPALEKTISAFPISFSFKGANLRP